MQLFWMRTWRAHIAKGGGLWGQDVELDSDDHGYEAGFKTSSIPDPRHLLSHRMNSTISQLAEQAKI